jgi:hypothetical protein
MVSVELKDIGVHTENQDVLGDFGFSLEFAPVSVIQFNSAVGVENFVVYIIYKFM